MSDTRANSRNFGKKGPFKVIICIITLWSFLFNIFAYDLAWAAKRPLEFTGVDSKRAGSPGSSLAVESALIEEGIEAGSHFKFKLAVMLVAASEKNLPLVIVFKNEDGGIDGVKVMPGIEGGERRKDSLAKADVVEVTLRKGTIISCGEAVTRNFSPSQESSLLSQVRLLDNQRVDWALGMQARKRRQAAMMSEIPQSEQTEITEVVEWYGDMYAYVANSYELTALQYTLLHEAQDPKRWVVPTELGASLGLNEVEYCTRLSNMTIAQLIEEYNTLEPDPYIHQQLGKTLPQLERIHFCKHLITRTIGMVSSYDDALSEAPEIIEKDPGRKVSALKAKKKMLLFREWTYRHWDSSPKAKSHLLFNLNPHTGGGMGGALEFMPRRNIGVFPGVKFWLWLLRMMMPLMRFAEPAKGGGEASTAARSPAEEALWEAIHKEIRRLLDECEDDPLSVAIDIEQLRKNLKDEYGISVGLKKLRALPNNPAFESYLQSKGLECVWNDDEHTTLLVLPIGPKLTVKPKETGPTAPDAETLEDINGPFIPRGHPSRKRFATGRPEEEKKEPSSNAQCISNTAIGGAETLISVGEEKALRASAQSLLELFQKMGYEEFLHAEDRDIKNLEVVNTDRDGLIYPEGANVAIAMEMNGGMQAAAYWASRDHFKNTNMILIPLTDSILIDRKNPYKLFVKIGLFFNKQGRLVLGRFEEPIPVHAISIPFYKPTKTFQYLDRTGVPNVGTSDAVAYTDDKAWTGRFFQENDIPTPQFDTITPGASDEEIKARIESAFEKYPEAQIIIKPANGVWGQDMREFGAEEMPNDFHHAKSILERGETVLIQGEVFPCLWAHTDYNLRVMTTWKGDEVITTEDMIEVKYRKLSERGAVNVSQGAGTMSLSEFFDTVGLRETAERIEFLQDLISSSKEDTLRLEDELSSKRAYPGLHKNVGIGGWDLMVEADRRGKIFFTRLEVNAVAVGNIKTMEGLLPQNKKGNAVLPIAEYLVDLAYKYKQQNPNIRFSGEGEYLNLLEQPFHAFSYGFSMLKLGEIALARRLFDVYKKVDPDNEFSRQRPDLIKAMKEYEENSLTKKDRTILAYTGRYPSDDETEDAPRAGPTAPDAKPLRRGKVTYGYFYPPAVDTTDIIFNGERISAADVRSKRNKAINVHEGTLNFNIRIDKDTVEIGFPSDDRYTRHRDIKNPSCEDEGTFRVYFGGMPNEDIYLIPDKVLRDNSSGKPIFLDDQKRYHNDVIRMARCLIECGFPSSSLFGHMKRILGRYMLFPSPQPQTLGELAARPYLTGEITIDIEKAKEAFETVFQDIADKFARTKNKELAELNNEEKEELQSRFTGFVHCHEIFHQLVVLAGISFANEEEECELADIFATRAMGLEVIESDHQARLNAFAEQVADDGIRRQLTLRYHTEGFLLNLHSLGVNIYNIKAEAIKNVPPGAKAMSRDKKVWGKNVTKETLAEMVEAGSFDASEKGREGYLFAMEVIRATVECRHPDLDENTRIIINSHIPQILRSMMVRAEFTQTFGNDMENLVNQMWKALENPAQLKFPALETYMRIMKEINVCLTEQIIRKYTPQSQEAERLLNSLKGRIDDFREAVKNVYKFRRTGLSTTAIEAMEQILTIANDNEQRVFEILEQYPLANPVPPTETRRPPRGLGDSRGYVNKLVSKAGDALAEGHFETALAYAQEALGLFDEFDDLYNRDDEAGFKKFWKKLDELEPGSGTSYFNDPEERERAENVRDAALAALGRLPKPSREASPATRAEKDYGLPVKTEEHESLGELIRRHFTKKDNVRGLDFGAGCGDRTREVKTLLEGIFTTVMFVGLERNEIFVREAEKMGMPVRHYDVDRLLELKMYPEGKFDLVTAHTPFAKSLNGFVAAAKHIIKDDGLIVFILARVDMENLLEGKNLSGNVDPRDALKALSGFKLVKLGEISNLVDRVFPITSYAFIYSPADDPGKQPPAVGGRPRSSRRPPGGPSNLSGSPKVPWEPSPIDAAIADVYAPPEPGLLGRRYMSGHPDGSAPKGGEATPESEWKLEGSFRIPLVEEKPFVEKSFPMEPIEEIADFIFDNNKMTCAENKEKSIRLVLRELAFNVMEHGKGGVIEVHFKRDGLNNITELKIVSIDNGPGLPEDKDPNILVRESLEAHKKIEEREAAGSAVPRSLRKKEGMSLIALEPDGSDGVVIEYDEKRFPRVRDNEDAEEWFSCETGGSKETRFTLTFLVQDSPADERQSFIEGELDEEQQHSTDWTSADGANVPGSSLIFSECVGQTLNDHTSGSKVLTIGVGKSSREVVAIVEKSPEAARLEFIDWDATPLRIVNRELIENECGRIPLYRDRVYLRQADARTLPYADNQYKVIWANQILGNIEDHYYNREGDLAIAHEALRVLEPEGTIIVYGIGKPVTEVLRETGFKVLNPSDSTRSLETIIAQKPVSKPVLSTAAAAETSPATPADDPGGGSRGGVTLPAFMRDAKVLDLAFGGVGHEQIASEHSGDLQKFIFNSLEEWGENRCRLKGSRLNGLNIGSGPGRFSRMVESRMPDCYLLDIDIANIRSNLVRPQRFVRADAERLPVKDSSQDFVISSFLLNYVDREKATQEMHRALDRNGRAVAILHHPFSLLFQIGVAYTSLDNRPYSEQIADIRNILDWLEKMKLLVNGQIEIHECRPNLPGSPYLTIMKSLELINVWFQKYGKAEPDEFMNSTTSQAIADDIHTLTNQLHGRLLWASEPNLLKSKEEIKQFFEGFGFRIIGEPKVLGIAGFDDTFAFGVVLEKSNDVASADTESVQEAVSAPDEIVRGRGCQLNKPVSELRSPCQNGHKMKNTAKLRLCVPWESLKRSADFRLALSNLTALHTPRTRKKAIPLQLVVTDVPEEDVALVESLNSNSDIREALHLPENLTVTVITEDDIRREASVTDELNPRIKAGIVKKLSLAKEPLADGEYMAIATEDVPKAETQKLGEQLRSELEEDKNISILVLESPKAGESVFSLSSMLNNWLETIQDGKNSIIAIIEAIPISSEKMARQLEQAIQNLWITLSAV